MWRAQLETQTRGPGNEVAGDAHCEIEKNIFIEAVLIVARLRTVLLVDSHFVWKSYLFLTKYEAQMPQTCFHSARNPGKCFLTRSLTHNLGRNKMEQLSCPPPLKATPNEGAKEQERVILASLKWWRGDGTHVPFILPKIADPTMLGCGNWNYFKAVESRGFYQYRDNYFSLK